MERKTFVAVVLVLIGLGLFSFFKWTPVGISILSDMSQSGQWLFLLITIAALIDSINPCAISVLLITIAFLMSLGRERRQIRVVGAVYIFGIFLVYLLIGLGLLKVLIFFNTPHFAAKVAAVILIGSGLVGIIGHYFPKFPIKLKIPNFVHGRMGKLMEKATLPGIFMLGVFVGIFEFPCTGGPYLLVLGLLHDHSTYIQGLFYLIYYNFVFVLPLIIALFIASDKMLYEKFDKWRKSENPYMKMASSIAMILLGLLMFAL